MKNRHLNTMEDKISNLDIESLGDEATEAAIESLKMLGPFCQDGIETTYHGMLTKIFMEARTSPENGKSTSSTCSPGLAHILDFTHYPSSLPSIRRMLQRSGNRHPRGISTHD
jgi:hypothetical protein